MSKQNRAYIIKVDGSIQELDHQPTLEEAQKIVGGYIELVHPVMHKDKVLIVDEDGVSKGLIFNKKATDIYLYSQIVGDVIVLEGWRSVK